MNNKNHQPIKDNLDYNNPPSVDSQSQSKDPNILKYFNFEHLPMRLQGTSMNFYSLAAYLNDILPDGYQKDMCLQKILEAKDCAVRSVL